jgi:hypothetical protein
LLTFRLQYCANDSECSNLAYNPPSENVCVKQSSGSDGLYNVWEGSEQSCTFPSGVSFSWNIQASAQSQANYAYVGYVSLYRGVQPLMAVSDRCSSAIAPAPTTTEALLASRTTTATVWDQASQSIHSIHSQAKWNGLTLGRSIISGMDPFQP